MRACLFWEEPATANYDSPLKAVNGSDLVDTVACLDVDIGEIIQRLLLAAVTPVVVQPGDRV